MADDQPDYRGLTLATPQRPLTEDELAANRQTLAEMFREFQRRFLAKHQMPEVKK